MMSRRSDAECFSDDWPRIPPRHICWRCGLPAYTVDELHAHPDCGSGRDDGPHDAPTVALAGPLIYEETGHA